MADSIVIVSAARTPIGGLLGDFSALAAHQLGSVAIKAAVERAGITGDAVNEVLMGNCLMAGQGQAPARQATLGAGLPQSAGAVTLSKMCGSGMRAMMFAHDMLKAESAEIVVAGGMESMTNAPHLTFARKGVRYGAPQLYDHMAIDGLEDAYERGKAMGVFAEQCVDKYKFSREAMDQFAIDSTERLAAELVLVDALLGEHAHRLAALIGVLEAVDRHVVVELGRAIAHALADEGEVRRVGHALHAAGHDDLGALGLRRVVHEHHRVRIPEPHIFESVTAPTDSGSPAPSIAWRAQHLALAGHQAVAHQHLADGVAGDAGALDRGLDGDGWVPQAR